MVNKTHKILCILQLCFAFSLFLWLLGDPFVGEHFRTRHDMLIIENVRGDTYLMDQSNQQDRAKLAANHHRWESLPLLTRSKIDQTYNELHSRIEASFIDKFLAGAYHLLVKTPFFVLAWVFFSIVISILCLKGREGAESASIILPLIVLLYAWDTGSKPPEISSFPTEKEIVKEYLKKPLSADLMSQKEELLHGFDLYLVQNWAGKTPSLNKETFISQRNEGEFFYNLSEIEKKMGKKNVFSPPQEHSFMILLYLAWNLLFSLTLMKDNQKGKALLTT